jgi:hypothetical protein
MLLQIEDRNVYPAIFRSKPSTTASAVSGKPLAIAGLREVT